MKIENRKIKIEDRHVPHFCASRGLTLVEMIVTVGLTAMIMVVVVNSVLYFYRANTSSIEQAYQIDSARKGVALLVKDVREASYADNGAYPLAHMASTSVTFYSDTDADANAERITYALTGTTLMRGVVDPVGNPAVYGGAAATSSVSQYVRNIDDGIPVFTYYDENNVEVTNPADIADVVSISVNIVVNVVATRAPGEFTLRSSSTLRNLRSQ